MSACCFAFPVVGIYTGDSLGALTEMSTQSEFPPEVTASVIAGQTYRIAIDGRFDEGTGEPARVFFAISAAMVLPPLSQAPVFQLGSVAGDSLDAAAPNTMIGKRVLKRRPPIWSFHFESTEPGSTFRCKLDRQPYRRCGSGKRYTDLAPGRHTLKAFAVDPAGNADSSPAVAHFAFPAGPKPKSRD